MRLDIRLPIGLMFSLIGAILAAFGMLAPDKSQALGHNVNLVWGLCVLGFGVLMLASWKLFPPRPGSATQPDEHAADRPPPHGH